MTNLLILLFRNLVVILVILGVIDGRFLSGVVTSWGFAYSAVGARLIQMETFFALPLLNFRVEFEHIVLPLLILSLKVHFCGLFIIMFKIFEFIIFLSLLLKEEFL